MNFKIRLKNPTFIANLLLGIILMVLSYFSLTPESLTTWQKLTDLGVQFISNPFLIFSVLWYIYMAFVDPTTAGIKDSELVLNKISVNQKQTPNLK